MAKLTNHQFHHIIFLAEVVLHGNKRKATMADTLQMLLLVAKAMPEVELSESVRDRIEELLGQIELQLKTENHKKKKKRASRS